MCVLLRRRGHLLKAVANVRAIRRRNDAARGGVVMNAHDQRPTTPERSGAGRSPRRWPSRPCSQADCWRGRDRPSSRAVEPTLKLERAQATVIAPRYEKTGLLRSRRLGGRRREPFEVRVIPAQLRQEAEGRLVRTGADRRLPTGSVAEDFSGLKKFTSAGHPDDGREGRPPFEGRTSAPTAVRPGPAAAGRPGQLAVPRVLRGNPYPAVRSGACRPGTPSRP